MLEFDILEKLKEHVKITPYSIDKRYYELAIQEIERLRNIVKETHYEDEK